MYRFLLLLHPTYRFWTCRPLSLPSVVYFSFIHYSAMRVNYRIKKFARRQVQQRSTKFIQNSAHHPPPFIIRSQTHTASINTDRDEHILAVYQVHSHNQVWHRKVSLGIKTYWSLNGPLQLLSNKFWWINRVILNNTTYTVNYGRMVFNVSEFLFAIKIRQVDRARFGL